MTPQDNLNNNLIEAVKECNLIKVKHLIEHGADIHADNDFSLRWSARNGHIDVVKYLVECGAGIHSENDYALRWSATNSHLEVVKYLVEQDADIYIYNDYALRYSAEKGHLNIVKYLIIDCNMIVKKETLDYLTGNKLLDTINIINSRNLQQQLENNLNKPIINDKIKIKL